MAKKKMPRVTEPDEGLVHYDSDGFSRNVTLCGLTDFLGHSQHGEPTDLPVTCAACKSVKAHCDKYSA